MEVIVVAGITIIIWELLRMLIVWDLKMESAKVLIRGAIDRLFTLIGMGPTCYQCDKPISRKEHSANWGVCNDCRYGMFRGERND